MRSHIPFSQRKNCTSIAGTARFSSLRTHIGVHQTRRDEMEALLYGIRHLAYGQLPWSGLTFTDKKEKHRVMHERKTATTLAELWGTLPEELPESFTLVRGLEFAEAPPSSPPPLKKVAKGFVFYLFIFGLRSRWEVRPPAPAGTEGLRRFGRRALEADKAALRFPSRDAGRAQGVAAAGGLEE